MLLSQNSQQLVLFSMPFDQNLDPTNRWVRLANLIPWDKLSEKYNRKMDRDMGTPAKEGRLIIGAVIIKHMENLTDEKTIEMIQENPYMQYFVGLSSFTTDKIFDPSLFVAIRKRLGGEFWNEINEYVIEVGKNKKNKNEEEPEDSGNEDKGNKGELLVDATVADQDITYPNDLDIVYTSQQKADELLSKACFKLRMNKPRTYPVIARKKYLTLALKNNKTHKEIRKGIRQQLGYLKRNINYLKRIVGSSSKEELRSIWTKKEIKYYETIQKVYEQQKYMYDNDIKSVEQRIVSVHQPYVRPIVRGKKGKRVEFGSKISVSIDEGYTRIEKLDWENYNEGDTLIATAENYKKRYGYYPEKIHADKRYCTQENRNWCKERNIKLVGKPLKKTAKLTREEISTIKQDHGKRNAVEGKFGQGKRKYGMNNIMAKLQDTSESWIHSIIFVVNLVRLMKDISSLFARIRSIIRHIVKEIGVLRFEKINCRIISLAISQQNQTLVS
jgi:hypothetical protein